MLLSFCWHHHKSDYHDYDGDRCGHESDGHDYDCDRHDYENDGHDYDCDRYGHENDGHDCDCDCYDHENDHLHNHHAPHELAKHFLDLLKLRVKRNLLWNA